MYLQDYLLTSVSEISKTLSGTNIPMNLPMPKLPIYPCQNLQNE